MRKWNSERVEEARTDMRTRRLAGDMARALTDEIFLNDRIKRYHGMGFVPEDDVAEYEQLFDEFYETHPDHIGHDDHVAARKRGDRRYHTDAVDMERRLREQGAI